MATRGSSNLSAAASEYWPPKAEVARSNRVGSASFIKALADNQSIAAETVHTPCTHPADFAESCTIVGFILSTEALVRLRVAGGQCLYSHRAARCERADGRSWSSGSSTGPAMPSRAGLRRAPTPIPRTRRDPGDVAVLPRAASAQMRTNGVT
jgi:hypothetical protein